MPQTLHVKINTYVFVLCLSIRFTLHYTTYNTAADSFAAGTDQLMVIRSVATHERTRLYDCVTASLYKARQKSSPKQYLADWFQLILQYFTGVLNAYINIYLPSYTSIWLIMRKLL